jgi:hypothetical protein
VFAPAPPVKFFAVSNIFIPIVVSGMAFWLDKKRSGRKDPADREIVITRVFDAPREVVFKAWTDPKQVAQS